MLDSERVDVALSKGFGECHVEFGEHAEQRQERMPRGRQERVSRGAARGVTRANGGGDCQGVLEGCGGPKLTSGQAAVAGQHASFMASTWWLKRSHCKR